MSPTRRPDRPPIRQERIFKRFSLAQRWEHALLLATFAVLLLTGLPQKYFELWGHQVLTTPQRMILVRQVHHFAAILLTLEIVYHLARGIYLMARRRLSSAIFPTLQDVRDAWQMIKYLLFLSPEKPRFGKYNFEQKFTYWFFFFGIGIMVITGFILWFPIPWTRFFPGATVPAALLAHSNEAIVATIFLVIWHFYHVHFERLNLSIFSGRMNESEMREQHPLEFERLTGENAEDAGQDHAGAGTAGHSSGAPGKTGSAAAGSAVKSGGAKPGSKKNQRKGRAA